MKDNKFISYINGKKLKEKRNLFINQGDLIQVIYCNLDKGSLIFHNYSGVCIKKKEKGISSSFLVRGLIDGYIVEKLFNLYSPYVLDIKVLKRGKKTDLKNSFPLKLKSSKLNKS